LRPRPEPVLVAGQNPRVGAGTEVLQGRLRATNEIGLVDDGGAQDTEVQEEPWLVRVHDGEAVPIEDLAPRARPCIEAPGFAKLAIRFLDVPGQQHGMCPLFVGRRASRLSRRLRGRGILRAGTGAVGGPASDTVALPGGRRAARQSTWRRRA